MVSEHNKLIASDGGYEDLFGSGAAIRGGDVIIGASGVGGPSGALNQGAIYLYDGLPIP